MNRRSPHILCVDDEQTIQSLLEFMLVPAGFKVVIACNGRQALEVLASQPVDLVLSVW
jgi:CheY-like chemotaxis protein